VLENFSAEGSEVAFQIEEGAKVQIKEPKLHNVRKELVVRKASDGESNQ